MSSNKKTLIDGDFQVGSAHFYVDVDNNRVGLNQANPASSLDVNGNAFIATDMTVASNVTVGSNVIAQKFTGSASGLTSVPADQISGVIPVANGGTGTTTTTGTGSLVKSDNPTFTGTVTADTFSGSGASLTNIPMGQATGTLAVANGGTGVTTSTGSGNTVLSASPTLTGTVTAETANFSSNISASNIYAGRDTDTTSYLGRAAVGFSGISDEATFAHVDVNSTNNYALKQSATGGTQVNAATGGAVIFSINDSEQARINTTGLGVGTDNPGFKLDVHGTANVGALTCTTISGDGYLLSNVAGYSWPTHLNGNDIYYTTGNVGIGTATPGNTLEVSGTASVPILKSAADAATSTYNYILNGPRPGTTSNGASHFINGSTRTTDGGASTYTIRNNSGKLRLGNGSYDTLIEGGNVSLRVMSGHETEGTLEFGRADGTDRVHNIKVYNSSTQNDNYMKFQIHAGGSSAGTLTDNVLYLRGDGNVGIGAADPLEKLDVRGAIITPVVSYAANQDAPYLIAGTSSYTGAATNWNTHGFQHRIKTNSGGVPRITVDAPAGGEVFTIENGGNVGIGTASPSSIFNIYGGALWDGSSMSSKVCATLEVGRGGGTGSAANDTGFGGILEFRHHSDSRFVTIESVSEAAYSASIGLSFKTHGGTGDGERMRIAGNGNVGIGTTSPQQKLEVHGNILLGQNNVDSFIHSGADIAMSSDTNVLIVSDANDVTGGASGDIIFGVGSAINMDTSRNFTYAQAYPSSVPRLEHMRIKGSGNVGIGTTSPEYKLHVNGETKFIGNIWKNWGTHKLIMNYDNTYRQGLNFSTADRTFTMFSTGGAGDGGTLTFNTRSAGGSNGDDIGVERMRIDQNGNVGIGTTSPATQFEIRGQTTSDIPTIRLTNTAPGNAVQDLGGLEVYSVDGGGDFCGSIIVRRDNDGAAPDGNIVFRTGQNGVSSDNMIIRNGGNVGIGTTSPRNKLEIKTTGSDSGLLHLFKTTGNGVGIDFCDQNSFLQKGFLRYHHQDSQALGAGNCFRFSSTEASEVLACGGSLLIGVDGKDNGAAVNGRKNLFIQSTYNGNTSQNYGWWLGAQNQVLASNDNDFYFNVVRNGTLTSAGWIQDGLTNVQMNFTGQHRTFVKDTPTNQLVDKEGLIVSADQNEFIKMSGGVAYGKDAITINESLPLVSLSTKSNDKKCFGVLSTTEDPETRKEVYGNFASNMHKEVGDTRVYVNSVGEGAIWVANTNGTLESGDYITTSNVVGYGMKQDDDILHNYTVAKILMDCDFNPVTQPKRTIRKDSRMVDYWIRYGDVKVTEEEYQTLPETKRKIVEDVHYRIDQMEVVKENPEKDTFVYEQREEMVNVLDEHGEFQWEETGETEKAYKIRYLDADGNITDEVNHVHKAAFVGCTYHCG